MSSNKVVASFMSQPQSGEPIKYFVEFDKVEHFLRVVRRDKQAMEQLEDAGITTAWDILFFFRGETDYREISISQTGGEMQVFATVLEIVKTFVQMVKPQAFYFSADEAEPSRVKLYFRIMRTFEKQGWTTLQTHDPSIGTEIFVAYKPQN